MNNVIAFEQIFPAALIEGERKHMKLRNGQVLRLGRSGLCQLVACSGGHVIAHLYGAPDLQTIRVLHPRAGNVLFVDNLCLQIRATGGARGIVDVLYVKITERADLAGPNRLRDVRIDLGSTKEVARHAQR